MEENKITFEQLASKWQTIYRSIQKTGKFSFDIFLEAFTGTYQLLQPKVCEPSIEKSILPIIVNASLFARSEAGENQDSKYKAALVLTERMLNFVLWENRCADCHETTIYLFEQRQDIDIDFSNLNESINTLVKLYDANYWANFQQ